MIIPDIKVLMDKMDSRYTLVVAAAKRARQIVDGDVKLTNYHSDKAVTLAIHEIAESRISYYRPTDQIASVLGEQYVEVAEDIVEEVIEEVAEDVAEDVGEEVEVEVVEEVVEDVVEEVFEESTI